MFKKTIAKFHLPLVEEDLSEHLKNDKFLCCLLLCVKDVALSDLNI